MAAPGDSKRAEAAGASDGVWPPPPTCAPVEAAPPRRLLLPLHMWLPQMPKGFGLPKWAKAARNEFFIAFMIIYLLLHSVIGKIMVGFLVVLLLLCLASLIFCMAVVAVMFVARRLGRTTEVVPPHWGKGIISAMDGWMGLVPNAMFLVWGLSYLDIYHIHRYHIHRINLVALIVWGSWFLLGCVVAVVNGVGQWLRERRAPMRAGPE